MEGDEQLNRKQHEAEGGVRIIILAPNHNLQVEYWQEEEEEEEEEVYLYLDAIIIRWAYTRKGRHIFYISTCTDRQTILT